MFYAGGVGEEAGAVEGVYSLRWGRGLCVAFDAFAWIWGLVYMETMGKNTCGLFTRQILTVTMVLFAG